MSAVQTIIALAALKIGALILAGWALCRLVDWITDKAIARTERRRG